MLSTAPSAAKRHSRAIAQRDLGGARAAPATGRLGVNVEVDGERHVLLQPKAAARQPQAVDAAQRSSAGIEPQPAMVRMPERAR